MWAKGGKKRAIVSIDFCKYCRSSQEKPVIFFQIAKDDLVYFKEVHLTC